MQLIFFVCEGAVAGRMFAWVKMLKKGERESKQVQANGKGKGRNKISTLIDSMLQVEGQRESVCIRVYEMLFSNGDSWASYLVFSQPCAFIGKV